MTATLKRVMPLQANGGDPSHGVIRWLLSGDVSLQFQASRDLLDRPDAALQRRIAREGWGGRFLTAQNEDGTWGRGFYQPKWTSSHYTLLDLRNLEIWPTHSAIQRSVLQIASRHKSEDGAIDPSRTRGQGDVCVNGMFLNYGCYFRLAASHLESIVDFLLDQQMDDGGFNCRSNRSGAKHSSVHSTLSVLEGIAEYRRNGYGYRVDELARAADQSREFLLRHRLFKSDRTGQVIHRDLLRLSYPTRWKYNVLRALDHFRAADAPWDDRMSDALDLVKTKRRTDGRWPLQAAHPGAVHFVMEQPRQPSRWNTLIALRVLKKYDSEPAWASE